MISRGDVRARVLPYFVLGIALPSLLLAYLAFRGIENDRALVERERRSELESAAVELERDLDRRLEELEALTADLTPEALAALARSRLEVEAAFSWGAGGEVEFLGAAGMLLAEEGAVRAREPSRELERARSLELREGRLEGALAAYRALATDPGSTPAVRASALSGMARVQRKLGRPEEAAESYRALRSGFGTLASPSGLPFGAAASLELAALLAPLGDTAAAAGVLLDLYRELLDGRWRLTPAQLELVAGGLRGELDALAPGLTRGQARTVDSLTALEDERRDGARRLATFAAEARPTLASSRDGARRGVVMVQQRAVPFTAHAASGDSGRGLVLDPEALVRAVAATGEESRVAWRLLGGDGREVGRSTAVPAPGSPVVTTGLDGLPGWSLELSLSPVGMDPGAVGSRRTFYLGAFLLIAGILASGLVLTLRTLGRELELVRLQSDFVSTVSHEFRSPLTSIRQLTEMLRDGRVPSEERRRRYYEVLLEQSERLSAVVENVLDLARMDEGTRPLRLDPVDVESLVEEMVADVEGRAGHRGFSVRTEVEGPLPRPLGDRTALAQALGNLLDNAVKYSGTSREVEVRAFRDGGEIVVSVRDRGIGLAAPDRDRVFDRFYRAGDELTRSVKGTGLGLALVKEIMDAHGGRAEVSSRSGEGSTFSLHLPVPDEVGENGTDPGGDG